MRSAITAEAAARLVHHGVSDMVGGFLGVGGPERLLDALAARGPTVSANDTARPSIGLSQYQAALHPPGSSLPPLFFLPDPPPTRQAVATALVTWSLSNAQHARERAVDGVVRRARSACPCAPDRTSDRERR